MVLQRFFSFISRISVRLLAFNILLVVMPLAGFLFLDIYETQLLSAQEDSMVQQGRLLSIALSENGPLQAERAVALLTRLKGRTMSRLRIVDQEGNLLADSSVLSDDPTARDPGGGESDAPVMSATDDLGLPDPQPAEETQAVAQPRTTDWLYEFFTGLVKFFRELTGAPRPDLESADYYSKDKPLLGSEIKAALEGRYGNTTRYSIGEQRRSIILYSAIPIPSNDRIVGAVLVSQSTYRILLDLYDVRMATLRIFLICLVLAIVLSLYMSRTIGVPLRKLRNEAEVVLDKRGRLTRPFRPTKRLDEIGDLGRSLTLLTERLEKHIRFIESFAGDLSHEFKNPLASIRSAAEIAFETTDLKERHKFLTMICQDVARMERLLTGARDLTRLDVEIAEEEPEEVALGPLLEHIVSGARLREKNISFIFPEPEKSVIVRGRTERFAQVFENILDNAVSFSPAESKIKIDLSARGNEAVVLIGDEGPGVPAEHREKIFERFFSFRPAQRPAHRQGALHTGLGLSVVKVIIEGYGGGVQVKESDYGGALFEIRIPRHEK